MSETWKGKTRGGTFGYMFFIYMIRCLGITAAYGFLALVVLYFIPFAPKATGNTWSYARNRLKYGRLKSVALLLKNYYRLGQILIDKVAIGNGMTGKYHFKFENYQTIDGYSLLRGCWWFSVRRAIAAREYPGCVLWAVGA